LGAIDSYAISITDSGFIVGTYTPAAGHPQGFTTAIIDPPPPTPTPDPNPDPPIGPLPLKPTLAVAKSKITTSQLKIFVHGTTSGEVTYVTCTIARGSTKKAYGTAKWGLNVPLKNKKTRLSFVAYGPGVQSDAKKVVVTRK
jgi:hypothetical protein